MSPHQRFLPALLVALSLLLLAGCGRQGLHPTAAVSPERDAAPSLAIRAPGGHPGPPDAAHGEFFPLAIGNRWHYAGKVSVLIVQDDGSPLAQFELSTTKASRLLGSETLGGREYLVEEDVIHEEGGGPDMVQRIFWRQDRTGLYEADVPIFPASRAGRPAPGAGTTALARAWTQLEGRLAGSASREAFRAARDRLVQKLAFFERALRAPARPLGQDPPPMEWVRLRYPLHAGAQWNMLEEPRFTAQVEGRDALSLPAGHFVGWRILYSSVFAAPGDLVRVWYGRDGYLALELHITAEAVDENGNHLGTAILDQTERLDGIELIGNGGQR